MTAETGMRRPIVVSAEDCRGCDMCMLACSLHHTGKCQPEAARLRVSRDPRHYVFTITMCRHCGEPACVIACPADAMKRDASGVVSIAAADCILCGSCQAACPYDAIFHDKDSGTYLKCDLCTDKVGGPLCVKVCPAQALSLSPADEETDPAEMCRMSPPS